MPREGPVLRAVDIPLQVLDAHAHGEGLALQGDAPSVQQLEHVAGRVPAGDDDVCSGQTLLDDEAGVGSLLP